MFASTQKSSNVDASNQMTTTKTTNSIKSGQHELKKINTQPPSNFLPAAISLKAPLVLACLAFLLSAFLNSVAKAKVIDFGPILPDFLDENPDKSLFIKFYAPWCYHCQQLEIPFTNVAESISRDQYRMIVGSVDCTKYWSICAKYGVQSYPTLIYLNNNSRVVYKGDLNSESMIDFVARLEGPDFKVVNDCDELKQAAQLHGLVVLSVAKNITNNYHEHFKSITSALKSDYWFYHIKRTCDKFITEDGLYLLKRNSNRAIKFEQKNNASFDLRDKDIKKEITEWIVKESLPVCGPINSVNFDRLMGTGKTLVIAVIKEYSQTADATINSFPLRFEILASQYNQDGNYDKFLFAWSTDLELIESIAIGKVPVPNVMILKPDHSYGLLIERPIIIRKGEEYELPEDLKEYSVKSFLESAKLGYATFKSGNSYRFSLMRHIFSQYITFMNMFRANPLLASLLIGLPSVVIIFVLYTTCYNRNNLDEVGDEDEGEDENEDQSLLNHVHQD